MACITASFTHAPPEVVLPITLSAVAWGFHYEGTRAQQQAQEHTSRAGEGMQSVRGRSSPPVGPNTLPSIAPATVRMHHRKGGTALTELPVNT